MTLSGDQKPKAEGPVRAKSANRLTHIDVGGVHLADFGQAGDLVDAPYQVFFGGGRPR